MVNMASVAMNGGVLNLVTIRPLRKLQSTAMTIDTMKAKSNDSVCLYRETERSPESAKTEPQERSSIPGMIKMVCPKAKIVVMEICLEMLVKLRTDKKFLLITDEMMKSATRTSKRPCLWITLRTTL
jgi:hypothetical protein